MTRHDDDSFESSLGLLLRRALRQKVDPETRDRHLDALTVQAARLREAGPTAEVLPMRPARPRWVGAVAAALVVLAFCSTTVIASQSALPGDVLYTVKRGTENARLLLATSPEAVAEVRADIAQARSEEAQLVAAAGGTAAEEQVESLQAEARSQIEQAAQEAPGAPGIGEAQERVEQDIEGSEELIGGSAPGGAAPAPAPNRPPAVATTPPPEEPTQAPVPSVPGTGAVESGTVTVPTVPLPTETPGDLPDVTPPAGAPGGSIIPSTQD